MKYSVKKSPYGCVQLLLTDILFSLQCLVAWVRFVLTGSGASDFSSNLIDLHCSFYTDDRSLSILLFISETVKEVITPNEQTYSIFRSVSIPHLNQNWLIIISLEGSVTTAFCDSNTFFKLSITLLKVIALIIH